MKLFYKEPFYLGVVSTFILIVVLFIDVYLIVFINDWWFRMLLILITYFVYVKSYHKTYLYEEKIVLKYSILKFRNKILEIDYNDCIIFKDANGPHHWDNFTITYRKGKEKKLMGFHILEKETIKDIINFLKSKNNKIKIKVEIPNS